MRSRRLIVVAPEAQTTMVAMPPVLWKGLGAYYNVRFGSKADMCGAKGMSALPRKRTCAAQQPMSAKCQ